MKKKYPGYGLFALILVACSASAAAGDAMKGKEKSVSCAGCHGAKGMGLGPELPNLAGQKEAYLVKQLKAFKSGARVDPSMKAMVAALSDADIENLAAYYASLERSVAAAPVAIAATADKATAAEFPHATFITMKKGGTVEMFPGEVVWQGGPNMLYDAVTPDGKLVLATSPSGNSVYILDADSGQQRAIVPVGTAPKGVKVTPDGRYAYVSNQGSAEVSVIDLGSFKVIDSIKVAEGPHNVRFTNDGSLAYVTLQGGAGIGVIDTGKREMIRVIPVPGITEPQHS